MKTKFLRMVGLLAVFALVLAACASDEADDTEAPDDAPAATEAADETFEVYALLPQGNDQPYGTTYLPPFEAKAAELGLNLTITNSQYDADKQASE